MIRPQLEPGVQVAHRVGRVVGDRGLDVQQPGGDQPVDEIGHVVAVGAGGAHHCIPQFPEARRSLGDQLEAYPNPGGLLQGDEGLTRRATEVLELRPHPPQAGVHVDGQPITDEAIPRQGGHRGVEVCAVGLEHSLHRDIRRER
jgi:hypothetical protein